MAEPASTAGDNPLGPLAIVASTAKISRVLKIGGYEALKGYPTGAIWRAPPFSLGNQYWRVDYLPNGDTEDNAEFISVFLVRTAGLALPVPVRACFNLSLLDRQREPVRAYTKTTGYLPFAAPGARQGFPRFVRRNYLERSRHLKDDEFYFRFEVSVILQVRGEDSTAPTLPLPPPMTARVLGDLLESGEGADVTFIIDGERLRAHRFILAAWSPVFRAGLWGSTMDADPRNSIEIKDMIPEAFKILLQFLYTERLPDLLPDERVPMLQHLFVASDRYDISQLKTLCEIGLYQSMGIEMAPSTLALAEQHNSQLLKDRCLRFIESPGIYEAVLQTQDFKYLNSHFPEVMLELLSRVGPRCR